MNIRASELNNILAREDKWNFAGKAELKKRLPSTGDPQMDSLLGIAEGKNDKDKKAEQIMTKFRSGQKLSPDELSYLAASNPEYYKEVVKIMQEREALERQMKAAKTKEQVANVYMNSLNAAAVKAENGASAEEISAEINQLSNAKQEYVQTAEYRGKPDRTLEEEDILQKTQEVEREEKKTEKEVEEKLEEKKEFLESVREKNGAQGAEEEKEEVGERMEEIREETEEKKKKRAKGSKKKKGGGAVRADFAELQKRIFEQQTFRKKVRALKEPSKTKTTKEGVKKEEAAADMALETAEGTVSGITSDTTAVSAEQHTAKSAAGGIVNWKV